MKFCIFPLIIIICCFGCKKHTDDPIPVTNFGNVLILGNSITFAGPDNSIGWAGSWGMAASSAGQDYVHLLAAKFRKYNDTCKVQAINIGSFESDFATFDLDANLKTYRESKPDILILRIGDNVESTSNLTLFTQKYQGLIAYMKIGNTALKILAVGPFTGGKSYVIDIMSRYTPFISLEKIGQSYGNDASYLTNVSDGVKQHPGDAGMQRIADAIWAQVRKM